MALPALALILALALAAVHAVAAHLACVDAARAGARSLSRGDDESAVLATIADIAPSGAAASVGLTATHARVEVTMSLPLVPGVTAPVTIGAQAATPLEDPVTGPGRRP